MKEDAPNPYLLGELFTFKVYDWLTVFGRMAAIAIISTTHCEICGSKFERLSPANRSMTVDGMGKAKCWPDIMIGKGATYSNLFHPRVVETLVDRRATGYNAFPVRITDVRDPALADIPAPHCYYHLEITGRAKVSLSHIDDEGGPVCPSCLERLTSKKSEYYYNTKPLRFLKDGWDESDFTGISNIGIGGFFVRKRIVEWAHEFQWSGFTFSVINAVGVNYLSPVWKDQLKVSLQRFDPVLYRDVDI